MTRGGINRKESTRAQRGRKGELPTRTCQSCGLSFSWRKKWERDWERVEYCSDRCRRAGNPSTRNQQAKGKGR